MAEVHDQAGSRIQSSPVGSTSTAPGAPVKLLTAIFQLLIIKFIAVTVAAYASSFAYFGIFLGEWAPAKQYIPASLLLAALVIAVSIGLGQLQAIQTQPLHRFMWSGLGAVALASSFFLSALLLFKLTDYYSRGTFVFQFVSVAATVLSLRVVAYRKLHSAIAAGSVQACRAVLIGDPANCARISDQLRETGIDIVHAIAFPRQRATSSDDDYDREIRNTVDSIRAFRPDDVVIVSSTDELPFVPLLTRRLWELPISLHVVPIDAASLLAASTRGEIGALVTIQVSTPPLSAFGQIAKRAFDIVFAAIALVVLAPLFAVVAIAIKLDSLGPVFFRDKRHGYYNETIDVLKFRSMRTAEEDGTFRQAVKGDPRITRLGRILRSTNIDELPQLVNVLTGEMSIVGPRPQPIALNKLFKERISPSWPFSRRHAIKPGITGWAQVNGYRGETDTLEKMEKRIEYDLYYIDHWSFLFDLKILVLTLFSKTAYTNAL